MSSKRTKSGQFANKQNEGITRQASEFTVGGALESLAKVQATVGSTFAGIGEQLQAKLQELDTVTKAVELKKEEVETIYGVEAIARSIEDAEAAFEATKADLARQELEVRKNYEVRLQTAGAEHHQAVINLTNQRTRDQEAWSFQFEIDKRNAKAKLDEELRQTMLSERVRKEQVEKNWADREENLRKQETEVVELRTKVNSFPGELDAEVKKQVAIVGNSMKRDHTHELQISASQFAATKTILDNTILNLNSKLVDKDSVISQLTVQLATAQKSSTDIANKALESAASRQQLADNQMMTQSQNGANATRKT